MERSTLKPFQRETPMQAEIYWVTPSLAILAHPRAGEWLQDEIASWKAHGIEVVVSLLEPHEASELGLEDEAVLCRQSEIEFYSSPIADRGVPEDYERVRSVISLGAGRTVGVHCRAGIGRSAMLIACMMVTQGVQPDEAFSLIAVARGIEVPDTEAQRDWVRAYAVRGRFPTGPSWS